MGPKLSGHATPRSAPVALSRDYAVSVRAGRGITGVGTSARCGLGQGLAAGHLLIVVAGQLVVQRSATRPRRVCALPGRATAMLHEPAEEHDCTFVLIFDGPFDLDVIASPPG